MTTIVTPKHTVDEKTMEAYILQHGHAKQGREPTPYVLRSDRAKSFEATMRATGALTAPHAYWCCNASFHSFKVVRED